MTETHTKRKGEGKHKRARHPSRREKKRKVEQSPFSNNNHPEPNERFLGFLHTIHLSPHSCDTVTGQIHLSEQSLMTRLPDAVMETTVLKQTYPPENQRVQCAFKDSMIH